MMWGYGADFFDAEGKLAINSPEAVQYVTGANLEVAGGWML